ESVEDVIRVMDGARQDVGGRVRLEVGEPVPVVPRVRRVGAPRDGGLLRHVPFVVITGMIGVVRVTRDFGIASGGKRMFRWKVPGMGDAVAGVSAIVPSERNERDQGRPRR